MKKLFDHYTITLITDTAERGRYMLNFKGRPHMSRQTIAECEREAEKHYAERKLRNFANLDLEQGMTVNHLASKQTGELS